MPVDTYLAVVYHPPVGHDVLAHLPATYALTDTQLSACPLKLIGLPVTWEHAGIHAATNALGPMALNAISVTSALQRLPDRTQTALGRVVDAYRAPDGGYWATLAVPLADMPNLRRMITSGIIGSVSLTHTFTDSGFTPLEIALVACPARPGCRIRLVVQCALKLQAYKRGVISGAISTMSITPMEVQTGTPTIQDIMAAMSPTSRQIVQDRMTYMLANLDTAKSDLVLANKAAADAKAQLGAMGATKTDTALMTAQLKQLVSAMNAEAKQHFGVTDPKQLSESLTSSDNAVMQNAALRTIMCCNQSMMMAQLQRDQGVRQDPVLTPSQPPETSEPGAKRARTIETDAERLSRALLEQFGDT